MPKIRFALLWVMATLPSFGQHSEVVVKRTEVIQISNGDESPNLSQVNSVTIYYISCNNVIYCGPPGADTSSSSVYAFTSGSNPLWATPSLLSSGVFTPAAVAALSTSIDGATVLSGSSPSNAEWLSSSIPALGTGTDAGQVLNFAQQSSPFTGDQTVFSANGISLSTAPQPSLVASAFLGSQTLSSALGNEPSWLAKGSSPDSASSLASVIGGSLPSFASDGNVDVGRLILAASSTTAPILTSAPALLGTTPLTGAAFPSALAIGNTSNLIGGLNAATGTNGESLNQQIESMRESGARIVSWSVLYDNGAVASN